MKLAQTLKSLLKMALQSRRVGSAKTAAPGETLLILGNGPSLSAHLREDAEVLARNPKLTVNFAVNTQEFMQLRPQMHLLADPHFFGDTDPNVKALWRRLDEEVDWPLTLLVPASAKVTVKNSHVAVRRFNAVGVEGYRWLEDLAYRTGLGMPRPRNVMIPAIMQGIRAGYGRIVLLGADHSWTRTLAVDDENRVVTVQPHFYADSATEKERVAQVYSDVRLHDMLQSMCIAFAAYHRIARFAAARGVAVVNATPGSFIDAFPRKALAALDI